jgi:hypothetical protein
MSVTRQEQEHEQEQEQRVARARGTDTSRPLRRASALSREPSLDETRCMFACCCALIAALHASFSLCAFSFVPRFVARPIPRNSSSSLLLLLLLLLDLTSSSLAKNPTRPLTFFLGVWTFFIRRCLPEPFYLKHTVPRVTYGVVLCVC